MSKTYCFLGISQEHSNIDVVCFFFPHWSRLRNLTVEQAPHDWVTSLDLVLLLASHEVKQLGVDLVSDLATFASLPIHFFRLFCFFLPAPKVTKGIINPKLVVILYIVDIRLLKLMEQFIIIENLGMCRFPDLFLWLEKYSKSTSFLLTLVFDSFPSF